MPNAILMAGTGVEGGELEWSPWGREVGSGVPDPQVPEKAKSRRYSAANKKRILEEYEQLDKAGKGALLRRESVLVADHQLASAA